MASSRSLGHAERSPPRSPEEGSALASAIGAKPWLLGLSIGLSVFACGAVGVAFLHDASDRQLDSSIQQSLRSVAVAAARTVDPALHAQIHSAHHESLPAYQQAIEPLEDLQRSLPDIRYVYTFRPLADGTVAFILDPVSPIDVARGILEDHVAPGTVYEAPDAAMTEAIRSTVATASPVVYEDKWGSFLSGYAPVLTRDGQVECFVGVDMDAAAYLARTHELHVAAGIGFGVSALAAAAAGVAAASWRIRRIERDAVARQSREQLERLTENIPGGVFAYEEASDGCGTLTFASGGFTGLCGHCTESLASGQHSILEIFHPDDRPVARHALERCRESWQPWVGEYRRLLPSGTIGWIEIRAMPRPGPGGTIRWHGFAADITLRKRTEAALQQAKADAVRANRAKGEFVANVSHELRTPMAAIVGYAELLREEQRSVQDPTVVAEALDAIARNGEHALAVINDIVDVERVESGQFAIAAVPIDLYSLAADSVKLLAVRASKKGIALRFDRPEGAAPVVVADPLRVRQILMNLVGNAIRFTEHGAVTLTIEDGPRSLTVAVTDTGPGMTSEQLSRLFERFSQLDPAKAAGGSGLGLAISRHLAKLLGGNVTVTSVAGEGSTFRLHLPKSAVAAPDAATLPSLATGLTGSAARPLDGLRVLLAEDGPDNARLLRHHLERAGAIVTHAENGRDAVALVRAAHVGVFEDPFDLVLMDMEMPEMDGAQATRELRASGVPLPIIALTAQAAIAERGRCLEAGCDDFACKPITRNDLVLLCVRWGAQSRRIRGAAADASGPADARHA